MSDDAGCDPTPVPASSIGGHVASLAPERHAETARDFLAFHQLSSPRTPDVVFLTRVLRAFMRIPYENLSKIIKFGETHQDLASLRFPEEVWNDFREFGLGGTCFSLTFFLQAIVTECGFTSYPVMAKMKAGPNRHCALVVQLDGKSLLLDPGYVVDMPIAIEKVARTQSPVDGLGVEIVPGDADRLHHLYTLQRGGRQWRYAFQNLPVDAAAFLKHWLASFQWNGMNGICLTRNSGKGIIYIHKHFMRETGAHGRTNHNLRETREAVIEDLFGIPARFVEAAEAAALARRKRKEKT